MLGFECQTSWDDRHSKFEEKLLKNIKNGRNYPDGTFENSMATTQKSVAYMKIPISKRTENQIKNLF